LNFQGFGDYVPGINQLTKVNGLDRQKAGRNLLIAAVFLFFGIAILAMCFDLMQEELLIKLSKIRGIFVWFDNESEIELPNTKLRQKKNSNVSSLNKNNNSDKTRIKSDQSDPSTVRSL
jgi:hypothetical protein